jgi:hypothetical protein
MCCEGDGKRRKAEERARDTREKESEREKGAMGKCNKHPPGIRTVLKVHAAALRTWRRPGSFVKPAGSPIGPENNASRVTHNGIHGMKGTLTITCHVIGWAHVTCADFKFLCANRDYPNNPTVLDPKP